MRLRADIFCRVIDNFGDIGVCWRLARQLQQEFAVAVTLWVDDLPTFARLAPGLDSCAAKQNINGLTVRHWPDDVGPICTEDVADLVIEGFACHLPSAYLNAMTARQPAPLWFNLEYLSAEPWIDDCHGLASIHPATGLTQYFWFPGFSAQSGGLLREGNLLTTRDQFLRDIHAQQAFWQRIGLPDAMSFRRRLSLFSYENTAIPSLLEALAYGEDSSLLIVPAGRTLGDVARWVGRPALSMSERIQRGQLSVAVLPLLTHEDYDRLLWSCQLNAVRGEDSFVRAQWAKQPLLWQIYPQAENAHLPKLDAFIHRLEKTVAMPMLWAEAMRAWNTGEARQALWADVIANLPLLADPACAWGKHLSSMTDLATGMMHFFRSRVE